MRTMIRRIENRRIFIVALALTSMAAFWNNAKAEQGGRRTVGEIERLEEALDELVSPDARMEVLCEEFDWTEGPVWVREGRFLLFSDIPNNAIVRWDEKSGCKTFLKPAGYTGNNARRGESGSNGLALDREGRLILCQHGDRRVARWDGQRDNPKPNFVTLAERYEGKRFNSPNDLVVHSSGAIYFTDPPYGLEKGIMDPAKELSFQGVYRIDPDGTVTLLNDELSRPNGIAFSPDEQTLYVSNSDAAQPMIMAYPVKSDGRLDQGRVFLDAAPLAAAIEGSCDGMKVDERGNLFATGPGGVHVITPEGKRLGTLLTGKRTSNCAFGEDGSTLFITADDTILRVRLKTKGSGY